MQTWMLIVESKKKKSSAASCNRNGPVNEQALTSLSKWCQCNMLNTVIKLMID